MNKTDIKPLFGKVCIVTGGSRGVGKGIAIQLAQNGAIVYITGRTLESNYGDTAGSLKETAAEIESRGGQCIPVKCDHSNDEEVIALFERVSREQNGRLDVLINNAFSGVTRMYKQFNVKFWEQPATIWDDINQVGLRNHYLCSVYAAKMMVPRRHGLIVNISSVGGLTYVLNCAYGIGKEACDRMASDCAVELKEHNVTFVSFWPGTVKTENFEENFLSRSPKVKMCLSKSQEDMFKATSELMESPEFCGKCIVSLALDSHVNKKTGKVLIGADVANEYGIKDSDGYIPFHMRQVNHLIQVAAPKWKWLATIIPNFVRIPSWLYAMAGNKLY